MPTEYMIVPEGLPIGDYIVSDDQMYEGPKFYIGTVAMIFIPMPDWRLRRIDSYVKDLPEPQRDHRAARVYTLGAIERLAHGLAQAGEIDGLQLINCLRAVQAVARLHKIIPEPDVIGPLDAPYL